MTYHAEVMCKLFNALEFNIKVPLSPDPNDSNVDYVFRVIGGILQQAFGHLSEDQILITVQGFLSFNVNLVQMKNHIRDFLVQIKERNGEDTTDLFLEERKKEIADAQSKKNLIPGMMNPNEANDEDEMR